MKAYACELTHRPDPEKLEHLARMREYLRYSIVRVETLLPITDWKALHPDQHETLAAFRIRFSEYQ